MGRHPPSLLGSKGPPTTISPAARFGLLASSLFLGLHGAGIIALLEHDLAISAAHISRTPDCEEEHMGPLRVAVIGAGFMGERHARIYAGLPDVRAGRRSATRARTPPAGLASATGAWPVLGPRGALRDGTTSTP